MEKLTSSLVSLLLPQPAGVCVAIEKSPEGFSARVLNQFQDEPNRQTLLHLQELVGEERLKRIFLRPELKTSFDAFTSNQLIVTKELIQKIWAGMADIRKEDLDQAAGSDVQGKSCALIAKTYEKLLPGRDALKLFCPVQQYDRADSSGKGFIGLMERTWSILTGFYAPKFGDERTEFEETEMFTSRLGDREPPVGTVAQYQGFLYCVERIFAKDGAYVTLWRNLSKPSHCFLTCRGTANRNEATSGRMSAINGYVREIGFLGIKGIWQELSEYLNANNVQSLDLLGKSLGGAHAQYLTALIMGLSKVQIQKVMTFASVGTPASVQRIYDRIIAQKKCLEPEVKIFRNAGDCVLQVGGKHLSNKGRTSVYYASLIDQVVQNRRCFCSRLCRFISSFTKEHLQQTSLLEFKLTQSHDIDLEISEGTRLEFLRKIVAMIFNLITLGKYNSDTIDAFFDREQAKLSV